MFDKIDVITGLNYLNIPLNKYNLDDLVTGINIELEHGLVSPKTNVTNSGLIETLKIALAHLNEFPNYYNKNYGLLAFEKFLKQKESMSNK